MNEPSQVPVAEPTQGFSCPGLMYLPGLLMILSFHLGVLGAASWQVCVAGQSWLLAGAAVGVLAAFWLAFFAVARWVGSNAAINLLGSTSTVLSLLGMVGAAVWWLIQAAQTLS